MSGSKVERYWLQFLNSLPPNSSRPTRFIDAFFFGVKPEDAQEIAALVLAGVKTSTASLRSSYDFDRKPVPQAGDLSIVTDGVGHPLCIIETTEVRILPFDKVDAVFAYEGGEDDRTLESWRRMYYAHITLECGRIGQTPTPEVPLVCERFRVIYKEPLRG